MALLKSERITRTELGDVDTSAELEAGLVKLIPDLRAFARSLAGNRELAEDLTQEALAKAWRYRRSFTPGSNLKAWTFAILRNEFFSQKRRAWRQAPWNAEKAETIPAAPEGQYWAIELSDTTSAILGLPDAQREALMLIGVGGMSYDDAAVLTGCAVGTLKSRVARARMLLRHRLDSRSPVPIEPASTDSTVVGESFLELMPTRSRVH